MTKFTDGPAAGVTLMLRRAPLFLRVVQAADGSWDALDLPADLPAPGEAIHVYVRTAHDGQVHLCRRGKGNSGWFQLATYRHCEQQPDDETARSYAKWGAWATARAEEMKAAAAEQPAAG